MSKKRGRKRRETVCRREIPKRYQNLLQVVRMSFRHILQAYALPVTRNGLVNPDDPGCDRVRIVCSPPYTFTVSCEAVMRACWEQTGLLQSRQFRNDHVHEDSQECRPLRS